MIKQIDFTCNLFAFFNFSGISGHMQPNAKNGLEA